MRVVNQAPSHRSPFAVWIGEIESGTPFELDTSKRSEVVWVKVKFDELAL